jgi:hypothetical protein
VSAGQSLAMVRSAVAAASVTATTKPATLSKRHVSASESDTDTKSAGDQLRPAAPAASRVISWAELAKHDQLGDLWIALNPDGKGHQAFNVTEWAKTHPGGWRLLEVRSWPLAARC